MRASAILVTLVFSVALVWACDKNAGAKTPAKTSTQVSKNTSGDATRGKALFAQKTCSACHQMDAKTVGPPLRGVVEKRGADWVARMIQEPAAMVKEDPIAKQLFEEYNKTPMPDMKLTDAETADLVTYLASVK